MALGALDPTVLPQFVERKGSLTLRSEYMRYGRGVLNDSWHEDRETEPKDYDISDLSKKQDLQLATYKKIGEDNVDIDPHETTTKVGTEEAIQLKDDYRTRQVRKPQVNMGNFNATVSDHIDQGRQPGVLPSHRPEHKMRYLNTTYGLDYQYPFEWEPIPEQTESTPDKQYGHKLSSFADTTTHKIRGVNTWHDSPGAIRNYDV